MRAKHTPGPWVSNGFAIEQENGPAFVIAHIEHDGDPDWPDQGIDESTAEANARLIAAAPDMLAALKALDANWSEFWPLGPDVPKSDTRIAEIADDTAAIWRDIRAAIAKAEAKP
jgi:hypothetical protein